MYLPDAPKDTNETIAVARVLAAAVSDPTVPMTVRALTKSTGLLAEEVRGALGNQILLDVLNQQVAVMAGSLVARGLHKMAEILDDDKTNAFAKIAAYRAVADTLDKAASRDYSRLTPKLLRTLDECVATLEGPVPPKSET